MTRYPQGPAASLGFLLWHLTLAWQRAVTAVLEPLGLTHVQFVLLACTWWLSRQGQVPNQLQLARQAGTDVKMTSQVVRRLEAKGLLDRQVDPGDSRARRLRLTAKGQRLGPARHHRRRTGRCPVLWDRGRRHHLATPAHNRPRTPARPRHRADWWWRLAIPHRGDGCHRAGSTLPLASWPTGAWVPSTASAGSRPCWSISPSSSPDQPTGPTTRPLTQYAATWSMGCFGDDGPFETGDAAEWTAREHACWRAGR